ncbi:hypothetical protein AA0114_g5163 [Alternaria tenuissima]|uniref:Uncharacterized protein n=1 Tax=Alternaria tenuissima TaxID=119927 RepID=A0A4Q4MLG3_9PLEO|nr:hypothetical protein AA0114_g5163 [Alternaria tenuissima]
MPQQQVSSGATNSPQQRSSDTGTLCPYHIAVLSSTSNTYASNMNPMDRFLAEGSAEQSAMFIRHDNGEPSTKRNCTCQRAHNAKM